VISYELITVFEIIGIIMVAILVKPYCYQTHEDWKRQFINSILIDRINKLREKGID